MRLSYYPGCALHGTSEEYNESILAVCRHLGVELEEVRDWNCCGASAAHVMNDGLAVSLPARNLQIAEEMGMEMLVPCAACFNRLKTAHAAILNSAGGQWASYKGELTILHVNELFNKQPLPQLLQESVVRPLEGLQAIPYYGCLTVRPPKIMAPENCEDPKGLDLILSTLGAQVVPWSFKTDCCGGNLALTRSEIVRKLTGDLFEMALEAGGECIVTDCPMCQTNMDTRQAEIEQERGKKYSLPVFYITELMGLALGEKKTCNWLKKHLVDPRPVLRRKGLIQ
ncbi:MAG: CoB--CoM heterodisulfide reductase iron-sulfur subunit B family protein [Deltaproteobacteria bacterium]|nr:CoB--CoM heterodisulfide reductase iron-sulfur subunit B family protein [Deltaproteobacteria bacterium]MBW2308537.1 CoB--CoM heterodisulfide reductase iron-sulfur subunit B family protein [Deltaproteobacteria bacterium]